ncbi:MAG: RluA family pseudouridine synthase [Phycisphaerales bacterium JB059]
MPPPEPLNILHETDDLLVIDKPAGLRAVPARGANRDLALRDSVESRVQDMFTLYDTPVIVHRLDMDTSGLMVVALTREAHRALSRQFMHRKTAKTYAALLLGDVHDDEGAIDLPLLVDWPNRPRQHPDFTNGKPARTLYRVLERDADRTRVAFRPVTGRTHQLRVHSATPRCLTDTPLPAEHTHRCAWPCRGGLGAPIAGATLYAQGAGADRLCLHADMLAFWSPTSGDWLKFESPAPF